MIGNRTNSLAFRALLVFVVGLAFAIPIANADGQTAGGLNEKIDEARTQAERLNAEIGEKVVALAGARQSALTTASQEAELSAVLASGQERAATLDVRAAQSRAELGDAKARLGRAQDALAQRLVDIYKSAGPSAIDVLLEADGFDDLATRADLLGRIQEADRALAARIDDLRQAVAAQLAAAAVARDRVTAHNARIEAARDQMAAARAAAEADAAALAAARQDQSAALAALESRVGDWRVQAAKLERAAAPPEPAAPDGSPAPTGAGPLQFGAWAIPEAIVMCESGGNFSALNPSSGAGGAYQILPSTWSAYGGQGLPHSAPPAEQHRIAAMIWADSGPSAWVCSG